MSETPNLHDPLLETVTRDQAMRVLRQEGVPDILIGRAFGLTRQRIHARLGPRPAFKRRVDAPKPDAKLDNLPDYIKDWRARNGLSIAAAARLAGLNKMAWWKWENKLADCSMPGLLLRYLALLEKHPNQIKKPRWASEASASPSSPATE
jgi:DNA-binding transcriptional regulator YiaG